MKDLRNWRKDTMASVKTYTDKIRKERYGKDVRSSIADSIDIVNEESEASVKKVNQAEANVNKAVTDATNATNAANTAASAATTAANNANEAAQAIFDENYILTARTEFAKSTRVSPTAKGNAIIEKIVGDSYQKQLTGKNLWLHGDISGTKFQVLTCNLPSGNYIFSSDVSSSDTDNDMCLLQFLTSFGTPFSYKIGRGGRQSVSISLTSDIVSIGLYASSGSSVSEGDTFTFKDIMVTLASEEDQTYEPYCGNTPSPNSEYKQDIHSTGDMGWFDGKFVKAYLNTANGSSIVTSDAVVNKNAIPCNSGDSIKIKYGGGLETVTDKPSRVCFYDVNGNFISGHNYNSANGIKAPNGAESFKFDMTFNSTTFKLSDVGHVCVTVNDKYALIVDEVGKNLWPCGDLSGNGSLISGQSVHMPKGTYTISLVSSAASGGCDIYFGNDKGSVRTVYFNNKDCNTRKSYTFTLMDDVNKIGLYGNTNTNITDVQLEEGSVETNFVAHMSKRHYIPLDEPLRGIRDVGDEIKCVDGLYGDFRKYGEKIYDSANLSAVSQTYGNVVYYALSKPTSMDGYGQFKSVVVTSNRFVSGHGVPSFNTEQAVNKIFTNATKDTIWLGFPIGTTLEEAQAIGDIVLVYPLATPIFTPFEDQTPFYKLMAYDEVTHVSIVGHEELEPMATIRFPRNEDGALETTNHCEKQLLKIENKAIRAEIEELTAALLALGRE